MLHVLQGKRNMHHGSVLPMSRMADHKYLSPPKTDTSLLVPTPMRVIQAQELCASLNESSPDEASAPILNILLSE
jgi:hypothetical protein